MVHLGFLVTHTTYLHTTTLRGTLPHPHTHCTTHTSSIPLYSGTSKHVHDSTHGLNMLVVHYTPYCHLSSIYRTLCLPFALLLPASFGCILCLHGHPPLHSHLHTRPAPPSPALLLLPQDLDRRGVWRGHAAQVWRFTFQARLHYSLLFLAVTEGLGTWRRELHTMARQLVCPFLYHPATPANYEACLYLLRRRTSPFL